MPKKEEAAADGCRLTSKMMTQHVEFLRVICGIDSLKFITKVEAKQRDDECEHPYNTTNALTAGFPFLFDTKPKSNKTFLCAWMLTLFVALLLLLLLLLLLFTIITILARETTSKKPCQSVEKSVH